MGGLVLHILEMEHPPGRTELMTVISSMEIEEMAFLQHNNTLAEDCQTFLTQVCRLRQSCTLDLR